MPICTYIGSMYTYAYLHKMIFRGLMLLKRYSRVLSRRFGTSTVLMTAQHTALTSRGRSCSIQMCLRTRKLQPAATAWCPAGWCYVITHGYPDVVYTQVLRYTKNLNRKKNKYWYSVWTGMPHSTNLSNQPAFLVISRSKCFLKSPSLTHSY